MIALVVIIVLLAVVLWYHRALEAVKQDLEEISDFLDLVADSDDRCFRSLDAANQYSKELEDRIAELIEEFYGAAEDDEEVFDPRPPRANTQP